MYGLHCSAQRVLVTLVLTLAAMAGMNSASQGIEIDDALTQKVAKPARGLGGDLVDMLVILDSPLATAAIERELSSLRPQERRVRAIEILKDHARAAQRELMAELQAAGSSVEDLQGLWISNTIRLRGDRRVLDLLAASPVSGWATENKPYAMVEAARKLAGGVEPAQPPTGPESTAAVTPNVWSLDWINVPAAWSTGYDGTGVLVGHLDSGVWLTHPDLAERLWVNAGEIPGNGIDDDDNGYVDDVHGYDFGDDDSDPSDDAWDFAGGGHGTHTAGTVVGDGTNGLRTGVAPGAKIIVCKPTWTENGYASSEAIWEAEQYALEMGAQLLTMSLGATGNMPLSMLQAERYSGDALRLAGVALFTSAGNAHTWTDPAFELTSIARVPAPWNGDPSSLYSSLSGVISVGATAYLEDTNWEFSSQGPADWSQVRPWSDWDVAGGDGLIKPDISAPGMGISSLRRPATYSQTNWNGTSMACPHAAGVAALMLSKNPSLTPRDLARILQQTAVDLGTPGKDNVFGAGRIDALAALQAVPAAIIPSIVIAKASLDDANGNGYVETGEAFDLVLELVNNSFVADAQTISLKSSVIMGGSVVEIADGRATAGPIPAGGTGTLADAISLTATAEARQGDRFALNVAISTTTGYAEKFDLYFSIGRPELVDQSSGNVHLTVTDRGTLGFRELDQLEGSGFGPKGAVSQLYIGGFWGGTGPDYVCDRDYTLVTPGDWEPSTSPIGQIDEPVAKRSDQDLVAIFNDSGHPSPRGIRVVQRSMVWNDEAYGDFVVIEYDIMNTGMTTVKDYRAAVFCDWDLFYPSYNFAGIDASRQMAWMSERYVTQDYAAVMALQPTTATNVSVVHNPTYVHPNLQLLDADKWKFMTGALTSPEGVDDDEYSVMVSAGPYTIAAGGRVKVAFALVYGTSLQDLQANADAAAAIYAAAPTATSPAPTNYRMALHQNTPNPFNPLTSISFEIASPGLVQLDIYDPRGRRVRELVRRRHEAGEHSIIWDGRDDNGNTMASGTYYYRLQSDRQTLTRKLTLLK